MYGALLLFESEFVHIVAISFTSLILTELLMVALTIQTWHWLMTVAELLSLACYIASLVFLHEFIGKTPPPTPPAAKAWQLGPGDASRAPGGRLDSSWTHPGLCVQQAWVLSCPRFVTGVPLGRAAVVNQLPATEAVGRDVSSVSFEKDAVLTGLEGVHSIQQRPGGFLQGAGHCAGLWGPLERSCPGFVHE